MNNRFDGMDDIELLILERGSYRPTMQNAGLAGLWLKGDELRKHIEDAQRAWDEVEAELERRHPNSETA